MSKCTQWVDQGVIACKQYVDQAVQACVSWADEGSSTCTQWADEGSSQCSSWADEGSNGCSSWAEQHCHWYSPWNCIAGWFCQAWYWVAKWVCKAWYWVAKWVCKAWMWVSKWVCKVVGWMVKAVCVVWSWIAKLVCVAWNWLSCAIIALARLIESLFGKTSGTPKIEHIFVLMLENRSFDHMFGFSGIQGVDAVSGIIREVDGLIGKNFTNVNPADGSVLTPTTPAPFQLPNEDDDPPHEFENAVEQLCGNGVTFDSANPYPPIDNSGFVASYRNATSAPQDLFACFAHDKNNEQLPVLSALAKEFAICDRWFSSLPGPTWPNRFFALAASSAGLDGSPSTGDMIAAITVDGYRFSNGHIFDRLDDNCRDWTVFEGDEFPIAFALTNMNLAALEGKFVEMDEFEETVNDPGFSSSFSFIEPRYGDGDFSAITDAFDHYRCGNSMHPLNDLTRGEALVKRVYEGLRNSPLWERSALIITFDEHGGFVDHVAPPAAVPPGDTPTPGNIQNHFKFDQLGARVPTLIVSPFIPRNVVDGTNYDHTSILATLERLLGMTPLTNRDRAANDFLHLFSLPTARQDTPAQLPEPANSGIVCDDDAHRLAETEQGLKAAHEVLLHVKSREAQRLANRPVTPMQIGFAAIAAKRLRDRQTPAQRALWSMRLGEIKNQRDFALFMTEAKLNLRFGEDLSSSRRSDPPESPEQDQPGYDGGTR